VTDPLSSRPKPPLSWRETLPWLAAGLGFLVLLWLLAPILTPFVLGAALAYLGDPIVDRLQRWRLSRTAGVCVVFLVIGLFSLVAVLLIIPMLYTQVVGLLNRIPEWLVWIQNTALPYLGITLPEGVGLDADGLKSIVTEHWSHAGEMASAIWTQVSSNGTRLLTTLVNLLMVPVVSFYLLRDWDDLVAWVRDMMPRKALPTVSKLAGETHDMLGSFIRGQLYVMLALGTFYSVGLWAVGLDLALVIGMIAGLISFVPYLGTIVGIIAALLAMFMQTGEWLPLVWVALIFGIGQLLEGAVLTPNLVGDKIGLHPVTVIFALMAGGQLFGFIGVMIALPMAAVFAVLFRHGKQHWLDSRVYQG
jgi:predicted PurR-regulated permease PerM